MTTNEIHDRAIIKMRAQYWEALPTNAYRVRKLARKQRAAELEPGEREELELLVQRLTDQAVSLRFDAVASILTQLGTALWNHRHGRPSRDLEDLCDQLDHVVDDMTLEVMAVGLRSLWYG